MAREFRNGGYVNVRNWEEIEVSVSSEEIRNLFTTSKIILPAISANKFYMIQNATLVHYFGGTAYGIAGNITLRCGTQGIYNFGTSLSNNSQTRAVLGQHLAGISTSYNGATGNINLSAATSNPTNGNGTFGVRLIYRIEDF